ncbi:hypothetical protein [Clostridium sp.]|uniref:hypothetical protein n=1 Tax=Clostridium sp. TaxID=1506 RepID=UPI003A5C4E2F
MKDNKNTDILIGYVDEIFQNNRFWENKSQRSDLGSTNIRALANTALNAESYKEFKLYIQYKIGKGNGWDLQFNNNIFGEVIISYLDKIYDMCNKDDEQTLKNISKFFGYFYWKKRYVEEKMKKNGNNHKNNGNSRKGR